MNINGKPINGEHFAFDGCHKIYICESVEDELDAKDMGYTLYPIEELQAAYGNSCPLRFISNWGLDRNFVSQFEEASFGDDEPPEQDPEPRYRARKDYTLDELKMKHWSDDT
jgi:hypothetical protein